MDMKKMLGAITKLQGTGESIKTVPVAATGKKILNESSKTDTESVKSSFKNVFNSLLSEADQVTTKPLQSQGQFQVDVGDETKFVAKDQQSANMMKQKIEQGDIQAVQETDDDGDWKYDYMRDKELDRKHDEWYIRIDGKTYADNRKQPVPFSNEGDARAFALKMSQHTRTPLSSFKLTKSQMDAKTVTEGKMKELDMDLKDKTMSDTEFKKKYKMTKAEIKNELKPSIKKESKMKNTYEAKKAKPDFLDLDKDGDKKESMKKAAADKKKDSANKKSSAGLTAAQKKLPPGLQKAVAKKKTVKEGANPTEAARLLGKAHATANDTFSCKYEEGTQEAQAYLDGYKSGLDECYGTGSMSGSSMTQMPSMVPGMDAMSIAPGIDDFEEDALIGGSETYDATDSDDFGYEDEDTMMAFEAWDKQLSTLLNENTEVSEGVTVAINKDIENAPDSVTVTAQGDEADQLLAMIKQAGMGLFGGDDEQTGSYGVPVQAPAAADVSVTQSEVGDHDSMMALLQKMTTDSQDYEDEETQDDEHVHGHPDAACDVCGSGDCGCGNKAVVVGEEQSEDEMEYEVAETADSDEAETTADEDAEAEEDKALAGADSGDEEEIVEGSIKKMAHEKAENVDKQQFISWAADYGMEEQEAAEFWDSVNDADTEEELNEWANDANNEREEDDSYYEDIDFMTKVISGGLNNEKKDQTTLPHTRVKVDESTQSINDWKKLSGIK
jgi:hypothetical protein